MKTEPVVAPAQYEIRRNDDPALRLASRRSSDYARAPSPERALFATVGEAHSWMAERGIDPAAHHVAVAPPPSEDEEDLAAAAAEPGSIPWERIMTSLMLLVVLAACWWPAPPR